MKTTLIFVRHGEATGNIDRIFHGFTDSDLTDNGRAQAKQTAKRLADFPIDHICSSDLKRAYETACAVAEPHGLTVAVDPRFREINGGLWENHYWDELGTLFPESGKTWLDAPHALQMPEGESMRDFFERLRDGVQDLLLHHKGETICVATHGTAIRVLCCYCKNKPLEELNDVAWCDNAAVTIVEHDENGFSMVLEGDNSHLGDLSTIKNQNWWR
ncbi:MAG: histidine phosphatase family protein [Ruminococcaceae bacterium]|nr:histidine phosphatase family protein [Oscillospiraceae bacterium]